MIFNELEIVSARSETKGLSVVGFPSVPKCSQVMVRKTYTFVTFYPWLLV